MCNAFEHSYEELDQIQELLFEDFSSIYLIEANKSPKLIKRSELERNTRGFATPTSPESGKRRIQRGENAKLMKYDFHKKEAQQKFGTQYNMVSYRVKSQEETEKKSGGHVGYVVYNASNRNVKQVWCSCKDFFFRLWAPYASAEFATFDIEKPYADHVKKKHNREWTNETNPEGTLFLCKHLYRAMTDVLDMENLSRISLAREEEVTEEEQELRNQIQTDIRAQDTAEDQTDEVKPAEPVGEPEVPPTDTEVPNEEPAPVEAPIQQKAPVKKVAPQKPIVPPKKPVPSKFEDEYDKFIDDLEKEDEKELRNYEKKKQIKNRSTTTVTKRDVANMIQDKLRGTK